MIKVEQLSQSFREQQVLDRLALRLGRGSFLVSLDPMAAVNQLCFDSSQAWIL